MAVRAQRPAFPHLNRLMERELERFRAEHPRSIELLGEASGAWLLDGVPMNWMGRWAGRLPVFVTEAIGLALPVRRRPESSTCASGTPAR